MPSGRLFANAKADLERRFGVAAARIDAIPPTPGAYLILAALDCPLPLSIATLPAIVLPRGVYVYAGSARGPGGMRARVARHLRRGKPRRWHIDHLTEAAAALLPIAVPGGNECALARSIVESKRYDFPLPGFGSSDCRRCVSHLLQARALIKGES